LLNVRAHSEHNAIAAAIQRQVRRPFRRAAYGRWLFWLVVELYRPDVTLMSSTAVTVTLCS
jgi:hypothetical protein